MKAALFTIALAATLVSSACRRTEVTTGQADEISRDPYRYETSLFQLLAHPQAYHGKKVQVRGVYFSGFEVSCIAPSRELAASVANCVWIDFNSYPPKKEREPSSTGEWVTVIGTFDAKSHGHLGRFGATIRDVERFGYSPSWVEEEMVNSAEKGPAPKRSAATSQSADAPGHP